ncbi:hypothetical protein JCM8097_008027 [Rhodosporidiobolus ruineniae]
MIGLMGFRTLTFSSFLCRIDSSSNVANLSSAFSLSFLFSGSGDTVLLTLPLAGSGWTEDEMEAWPTEGKGEGRPQWTGWVLDDERRYPPVARARSAGASAAYRTVRHQVLLAKQRLTEVDGARHLDWMRRIEVEEEVRLWMSMQDLAARFAGYAVDAADRERSSQDARFVADGGSPPSSPVSRRA